MDERLKEIKEKVQQRDVESMEGRRVRQGVNNNRTIEAGGES